MGTNPAKALAGATEGLILSLDIKEGDGDAVIPLLPFFLFCGGDVKMAGAVWGEDVIMVVDFVLVIAVVLLVVFDLSMFDNGSRSGLCDTPRYS